MPWNHRLVRYRDGSGYGVHEVYYNKDGQPCAMTQEPIRIDARKDPVMGEDDTDESLLEDITVTVERIVRAVKSTPVLDEPETWAEFDN